MSLSRFTKPDDRVGRVVRYSDIAKFTENLKGAHWYHTDISMLNDKTDWAKLTEGVRTYYSYILAFFWDADNIIIGNLADNFISEFKARDVRAFYTAQTEQEETHALAYDLQVQALFNEEQQAKLKDFVNGMPVIGRMHDWIRGWMDRQYPLAQRLAAFCFVEGLFFSTHFLSITFLKLENLMPGLTLFNEYISRDEASHCNFASYLLNTYSNKEERPTFECIKQMVAGALDCLREFFKESLTEAYKAQHGKEMPEGKIISVVPYVELDLMIKYLEFYSDIICVQMGYDKIYKTKNPYPEENLQGLNATQKTNFFERKVTQYCEPQAANRTVFLMDDKPVKGNFWGVVDELENEKLSN